MSRTPDGVKYVEPTPKARLATPRTAAMASELRCPAR